MNISQYKKQNLMHILPDVKGTYEPFADLAQKAWFRVGGPAEVLYTPLDQADLILFLKNIDRGIPVNVIGFASNILIRDGGIPGVTIRLGKEFSRIKKESNIIECGCGAACAAIALKTRDYGVTGFEFLSGIPGSIGGAIKMNAGAYGNEIKDIFVNVIAVDSLGEIHSLKLDDLGFAYRSCSVPDDFIFLNVNLKTSFDDPNIIGSRIQEIRSRRLDTQPVNMRTGGSTFSNPPNHKAWELIDRAGCRGLSIGGASVSEKHTNFIINTGSATADDIELLGEEVRRRVFNVTGVKLDWEIIRLGVGVHHKDSPLTLHREVQ